MRRVLFSALLLALCVCSAFGQQKAKSWTELSEKEAAKILNDSPWSQTQTEGDESQPRQTSAVTQVAAPRSADRQLSREGEAPDIKAARVIKFRMRFLSAKPVRGAFARIVALRKGEIDENLSTELQGFVDRDFADYVVVAVNAEASDPKLVGRAMQLLTTATAETLKEKVYLERKDGKKLPLADYRPPGTDGMGAKFVFMRNVEGQPFLTADSDNVRFFAQLSEKLKLNAKYKVSEMMYDGKLEY